MVRPVSEHSVSVPVPRRRSRGGALDQGHMSIAELSAWRKEILALEIVRDDDDSVPEDEAGRCFQRFVELADLVEEQRGRRPRSWWHR